MAALVFLSSCETGGIRPNSAGDTVSSSSDKKEESSEAMSEHPTATQNEDTKQSDSEKTTVYFTSDISSEGLVKVYNALRFNPSGKVAVKISTGEPPASNYLRPELIKGLVQLVHGTIVECNTAYGGSRSSVAMNKQVAKDNGFTDIAPFDLLDEDGETEWPVTVGTRLDRAIVGRHAENYTDWIILSHFKDDDGRSRARRNWQRG